MFQAITGYELDKVTVNAVMENGNVERMIVNNGNMPVYENGNYFATVLTKDGSMEVMAFQVENVGREASTQGGLHWGYGVLIGMGSAAIVGAVIIVVLRKKILG